MFPRRCYVSRLAYEARGGGDVMVAHDLKSVFHLRRFV